jgi:hypothetical protein
VLGFSTLPAEALGEAVRRLAAILRRHLPADRPGHLPTHLPTGAAGKPLASVAAGSQRSRRA